MSKQKILIILFLFGFIAWSIFMEYRNETKWLVESIQSGFEGDVVEMFHTNRSFVFKLLDERGDTIEISKATLNPKFYSTIELNMHLIKPRNENYILMVNTSGDTTKMYYEGISWDARDNYFFPLEWKSKWSESSEWDL